MGHPPEPFLLTTDSPQGDPVHITQLELSHSSTGSSVCPPDQSRLPCWVTLHCYSLSSGVWSPVGVQACKWVWSYLAGSVPGCRTLPVSHLSSLSERMLPAPDRPRRMPPAYTTPRTPAGLERATGVLAGPGTGWKGGGSLAVGVLVCSFLPLPRGVLGVQPCSQQSPKRRRLPQDAPLPPQPPHPRRGPTWTTGRPGPRSCVPRPGAAASGADGRGRSVSGAGSRPGRPTRAAPPKATCQSQLRFRPALPGRVAPGRPPRRAGGRGGARQSGPRPADVRRGGRASRVCGAMVRPPLRPPPCSWSRQTARPVWRRAAPAVGGRVGLWRS